MMKKIHTGIRLVFLIGNKEYRDMNWLIRSFFRSVRRVMGPIILLLDKITSPKGVVRSTDIQQKLDLTTQYLALYQYKTCPFCIKVRREIKRNSLNIELRDVQHNPEYKQQLLEGGGQIKVPCLQIQNEDGNINWLYESSDVVTYLHKLVLNQ